MVQPVEKDALLQELDQAAEDWDNMPEWMKPLTLIPGLASRVLPRTRGGCHPACALGPQADHPGYLGYRCITESVDPLPWPGEDGYEASVIPPGSHGPQD